MIQISVSLDDKEIARIKVCDRINLIAGNSGSGKSFTAFASERRNDDTYDVKVINLMDNTSVNYSLCKSVADLQLFISDRENDYTVCIIDEYLADDLKEDSKLQWLREKMYGKCAYFVIFQRDYLSDFKSGVNSIYRLVKEDNLIVNKRFVILSEVDSADELKELDKILVEDKESGFSIIRHFFQPDTQIAKTLGHLKEELNLIDVISARGDANLKEKMKELKGLNILTFMDYDRGAFMLKIFKLATDKNEIDISKFIFVRAELFEEIICSSEFVKSLGKFDADMVENPENYLDCSFESRGQYFIYLLKSYFVDAQYKNGKIITRPRYKKNNPACFKRNCKDCTNMICGLRNDSADKLDLVFTGKYKFIADLYYMLKEKKESQSNQE